MRYYLIILFFSCYSIIFCQSKIKCVISGNTNVSIGLGTDISSFFYFETIGFAFQLNEKLNIGTQLDFMIGQNRNYNTSRMKNFYNSFFLEYRPLEKRRLSPKIKTEFGYQLYSNSKNYMFNNSLGLLSDPPHPNFPPIGYFQKSGPFNNTVISLSVKFKHFEFSIGGGYRVNRIKYKMFYTNEETVVFLHGPSASIGFSYTF